MSRELLPDGGEDSAADGADGGDADTDTKGPDAASVVRLTGEHLATVLSEAWTNRGWETDVVEDEDGTFLVTGDQGNGQRGLILVLPGDVEVPGKRVQQYVSLVEKKSVDVRVVTSQGSFTDDAERIANANDVHLLDPQAVLETVEAEGLEDTLARYATGGGSGGGGRVGSAISRIPVPVPTSAFPNGIPIPSLGGKSLKSVFLVVLIAVSLLAGFAGGAFLAPAAGGGAGGAAGGALAGAMGSLGLDAAGTGEVAVSALSTAQPADAGMTVRWNARTATSVVANGSNFEAPNQTRFLVVQYAVTNTGDQQIPVRPSDFLVNANGTRYTHQPLDGARTFELAAVAPGNQTTGWVVYAIPQDATDAVLVPDPDAAGGPITYRYDATMPINGS